ncbi:MAG: hypothetical protein K2J20_06550, partial [Bacilli bacterium]|nr:hypothetical protein [Bacilli bacterium]
IIIGIILISMTVIVFKTLKEDDFQFKTLSTTCSDFNISGNIAYNDTKSAIYITNIQYCGGEDTYEYKKIECILYEAHKDTQKKISSYNYDSEKTIKLEEFLKDVTLTVDNYEKNCSDYQEDSLYLEIYATNNDNKTISYKIPLMLNSCNTSK